MLTAHIEKRRRPRKSSQRMPRGTNLRAIRIDDTLWLAAKEKASAEGVSVSEVVRAQLARWVKKPPRK